MVPAHKDCHLIIRPRPGSFASAHRTWKTYAFPLALLLLALSAHAQKLRMEFEPLWANAPLAPARPPAHSHATNLTVTRLDGLLSELALQRADGTWLESRDWFVFLSAEKRRLSASADGLPAQEFKAIRFRVGLNSKLNASDPQDWPADHPLHPDVCGLHWGWRSGYVFLALEGHWSPAPGKTGGYSYHLAGTNHAMMVELPVKFSGARSTTVRIGLDAAAILDRGKVLEESTSTHSRDDDPLAATLMDRAVKSFRVLGVQTDLYQPVELAPTVVRTLPTNATPYRLDISERLPKVNLPADNPLTVEGVALGRRLFHEPRLSRNHSQSCASCHERSKAFTDGRAFSLGESGQRGRRNSMPLVNLAWAKEFFWDGRAKSLREQVLLPIQDTHEMNETLERVTARLREDSDYAAAFKAAFGSPDVSANRIALALEQFLLTLVSQESKFDRAARNLTPLTEQEQRGLQLFVTEHDPKRGLRGADCFHCHGGNLFSNHQFINNGLKPDANDPGRMEITKADADQNKFKVPSLRNIALTAPYMHDGRFATLEEVIDHYNGSLHRSATLDPNLAKHPEAGFGLSAEDKAALVAFLKTLTDEQFVSAPTTTNPFTKTK